VSVSSKFPDNLGILDFRIDRSGSVYSAHNKFGVWERSDDFVDLVNTCLVDMDHEGIIGITGGNTYVEDTQILVTGSGSPLEKQIEICGVGGGTWPLIDASSGIHGLEFERGANIHAHRLHLQPHTSGGGKALFGDETAGQNAYNENSVWWASFGDLKMEGGTSGNWLVDLELPEWFTFYGRIYLDGGSGVNGMRLSNSSTAQFSYGESVNHALIAISTNGANTTAMHFNGNSSKPLNLAEWYGRLWLRNDTDSDGTIGLRADYLRSSKIRGIHIENMNICLQQNTGTQNTVFDGGMSLWDTASNGSDRIFVDANAGFNCTFQAIQMFFGGATMVAVDDENDNPNSPHKYEDVVLWGTGGTITADLGASAQVENYDNDKWYRQLGSGTFP
jgi:hypothetical protein